MGPIDYTLPNTPAFGQQFMQGVQGGLGLQQIEQERIQQEQARVQQQQLNADLVAASKDPSLLPGVMTRYPQLAEKLSAGYKAATAEQQRAQLQHGSEVASALAAGRPDLAIQTLNDRATALRNSGDEQGAKKVETMAQWAKEHPETLLTSTLATMYSLGEDGKRAADGVIAARKAPTEERQAVAVADKAESDAATAKVAAQYAGQNAILDLQKKGWDIKKIGADIDIARENNRIQAMNAATNRETNALRKQELEIKVKDAKTALDDKIREKVAAAESGAATLDNLLNTIEKIKASKHLGTVVGPYAGNELYPHSVMGAPGIGTATGLVTSAEDRSNVIADIDQLQSQATLGQLLALKNASATGASGFGALSQKELAVIESGIQSLSRKQGETQFRNKLDELSRLMKKNRDLLSTKYGVPVGVPDTPAAPGARPPLSSFGGG